MPAGNSHADDASTNRAQSAAWIAVGSDIKAAQLDLSGAANHIATASQDVTVATNSMGGYKVVAQAADGSTTALTRAQDASAETKMTIPMTTSTSLTALSDRTWGVNTSGSTTTFGALATTGTGGATIEATQPTTHDKTSTASSTSAKHTYTYGVRVDNPVTVPAGVYSTEVTYSVTANLPNAPTIASVSPSEYRYNASIAQTDTMTITGTNLNSVYRVYLTPTGLSAADQANSSNQYDCAITSATSDSLSCKIPNNDAGGPLSEDKMTAMAGTAGKKYDVHLVGQAGEDKIATKENTFAYYKVREVAGTAQHRTPSETDKTQFGSVDSTDNLVVTLDPHMIPIKYAGASYKSDTTAQGATETAKWSVVTNSELAADSNSWFNYDNTFNGDGKISGKTAKWANAITVKANKLDKYLKCEEDSSSSSDCTNIPEDDVLGYWVYIPRYAYRVRRYQASDKFVSQRNFDIHFETASTPKSIPAASCNPSPTEATAADIWTDGNPNNQQSNIKVAYYEDSCTGSKAINKTYHGTALADNKYTGTSWATHPAFTFGNKELNGFWMAKYEMTGSRSQQSGDKTGPTVKPNQVSNTSEPIGQYMAMARSMGITQTAYNGDYVDGSRGYGKLTKDSHSLSMYAGMLSTNKQWGAATYLSASQYGAGVNNVQNNGYDNWYKTSTNSSGQTVYSRQVDADGDTISYCDSHNCFSTNGVDSNDSGTTVNGNDNSKPISVIGGQLTGCGPYSSGSSDAYAKGGIGEIYSGNNSMKNAECAAGNDHAYQGSLGVLASTTNNVYGIYDMAGGNWDYVAANLTNRAGKTASTAYRTLTGYQFMGSVISSEMTSPYVDLFNGDDGANNTTNNHSYDIDTEWTKNNGKPAFTLDDKDNYTKAKNAGTAASSLYVTRTNWSDNTGDTRSYFYNNDYCTWSECGGGALQETKSSQSVSGWGSSWGSDDSYFPYAQGSWMGRGGRVGGRSLAGVFAPDDGNGWGYYDRSARVVAAEY